ncbi:hypothetical protein OsJ_09565 [Oryza sativa Japonica Group]|uniref:DUF3778 domain-containing protein n=1 Tax=Oryza sativa subsp. japonica TaxID=39947 RepID=A3AEJ1_ORYSJ|nr:hypothetical protein OsJ_09565 [Oryza sativa Japonica Group]
MEVEDGGGGAIEAGDGGGDKVGDGGGADPVRGGGGGADPVCGRRRWRGPAPRQRRRARTRPVGQAAPDPSAGSAGGSDAAHGGRQLARIQSAAAPAARTLPVATAVARILSAAAQAARTLPVASAAARIQSAAAAAARSRPVVTAASPIQSVAAAMVRTWPAATVAARGLSPTSLLPVVSLFHGAGHLFLSHLHHLSRTEADLQPFKCFFLEEETMLGFVIRVELGPPDEPRGDPWLIPVTHTPKSTAQHQTSVLCRFRGGSRWGLTVCQADCTSFEAQGSSRRGFAADPCRLAPFSVLMLGYFRKVAFVVQLTLLS